MTIQLFKDYIPTAHYTPTAETTTYNHQVYTVYRLNQPLSLGKKVCLAIRTITSLFQRKDDQTIRSQKAIFIHSKTFLLNAVQKKGLNLLYAQQDLKQDKEVVLAAIKQNSLAMHFAHETLKQDQHFLLEALGKNNSALQHINDDIKQNKEFVLAAVAQDGCALEYVCEDFKKDKKVVLAAIAQNEYALQFAHESLKQDKRFILEVLKQNEPALRYMNEHLKRNKNFFLKIVKKNGQALKHAHKDVTKDKEIAQVAIKQNGQAIKYVHEDLKKDRKFIIHLVKHNSYIFQFLSDDLRQDKNLILLIVEDNDQFLQYILDHLKQDQDFILELIARNTHAFQHIQENLKKDKKFILKAIESNICILESIDEDLKKDKDFALEATKKIAKALQFLHEDLRKDQDFNLKAIEQNSNTLKFLHEDLKKDKEFFLKASKKKLDVLYYLDDELKKDKEFFLEAAKHNVHAVRYAHKDLRQQKEFALEAVTQDGLILKYITHADSTIIKAAHHSLNAKLQLWLDDPQQVTALFEYASCIVNDFESFFLHEEHPVLQKAIEAFCLTCQSNNPNSPYVLHHNLQKIVQEETLIDDFKGWRKRSNKQTFTYADIPKGVIPLQTLFKTIEQRGVDEKEVAELCCGASLQQIKENVLGEGKIVSVLLMQKFNKEDPIPLASRYLYFILKSIANADDTREGKRLSARESQLLKFASMIKECSTGQIDAIEQYYINTLSLGAINTSQSKIEEVIDYAMQMTLKKALASDVVLTDLIGKFPTQQSHQTLYLQNRYHKQIGLIHSLRFDRHSGVIDRTLIDKDLHETLAIIKRHLKSQQEAKKALDQALIGSQGLKITYMEFIAYFEKEFKLKADEYDQYIEFDEKMHPIGITPLAVEKMLKKLEYTA